MIKNDIFGDIKMRNNESDDEIYESCIFKSN